MSLDKTTLKAAIKTAMLTARTNTTDPVQAADDFAGAIADAVDIYVKGMTINYTTGLADSSGPVTGTFGNTIS